MTKSTNDHIQEKTTLKSEVGVVLIKLCLLYEEIQNNGGCLEAAGPDKGWFLQPREGQRDRGLNWSLLKKIQGHSWWRHQMEAFSTLLALCVGNSLVTGEFPSQRPVSWSFNVSFDLCLNKQLSKQSWGWWFEMSSCSLQRHCNGY